MIRPITHFLEDNETRLLNYITNKKIGTLTDDGRELMTQLKTKFVEAGKEWEQRVSSPAPSSHPEAHRRLKLQFVQQLTV